MGFPKQAGQEVGEGWAVSLANLGSKEPSPSARLFRPSSFASLTIINLMGGGCSFARAGPGGFGGQW